MSCGLDPQALLRVLQEIESAAGRDPHAPRDAARPLDLDILLFGELAVDSRDLVVPHRRLAQREFWLTPLVELGVSREMVQRSVRSRPLLVEDSGALSALTARWRRGDCSVGLVPTMGALHEGHTALVRAARQECDRVVVSIFVNPLQFGPNEDLARYPRTMDADMELLAREDVDAVFVPAAAEFQPAGFCSRVQVGSAAEGMEGEQRAGHFEGVATVVAQLFAVARPDAAYFGRKDAQQVAVVERMRRDLGFPVRIRACSIVREDDGLAMSSRNVYLEPEDRRAAVVLYQALSAAREAHRGGERDAERLLGAARAVLEREPRCRVDYLELRSEPELAPWVDGTPVERARLLVAGRFGAQSRQTRLLDNTVLGVGLPDGIAAAVERGSEGEVAG